MHDIFYLIIFNIQSSNNKYRRSIAKLSELTDLVKPLSNSYGPYFRILSLEEKVVIPLKIVRRFK